MKITRRIRARIPRAPCVSYVVYVLNEEIAMQSSTAALSRNERRTRLAEERVRHLARRGPEAISERLAELDQEWDIERALEAHGAGTALAGAGLGAFVDRRFFYLPAAVAGLLLQQALQGWCPYA